MKNTYLFFSILLLCVQLCTWAGIYKVQTLVHKDTQKKITFLYDVHDKNDYAIMKYLLRFFKGVGESNSGAVLFECDLDNHEKCETLKEKVLKNEVIMLRAIFFILHSKGYKNFYSQDIRIDLIETLVQWVLEVDVSKAFYRFCSCYPIEAQRIISTLVSRLSSNVLKKVSFTEKQKEREVLYSLLKKVKSAVSEIDRASAFGTPRHTSFNLSNREKEKSRVFWKKLFCGIVQSLPEMDWFQRINELFLSYDHVIAYLGGAHCDNLIKSFIACGYKVDPLLSIENEGFSLLSLNQITNVFTLFFGPKEITAPADFIETLPYKMRAKIFKNKKGISKAPHKMAIKRKAKKGV